MESLRSVIEECKKTMKGYLSLLFNLEEAAIEEKTVFTSLYWDGVSNELGIGGFLHGFYTDFEAIFVIDGDQIRVKRLQIHPSYLTLEVDEEAERKEDH